MGRERAAAWAAEHPEVGVLWLEPAEGTTHAWVWNLPGVEAEPDARLQWMTAP